ncbi:hypothetical protein VTO42DRAFT_3789 [Malbranchea cinnamomea]
MVVSSRLVSGEMRNAACGAARFPGNEQGTEEQTPVLYTCGGGWMVYFQAQGWLMSAQIIGQSTGRDIYFIFTASTTMSACWKTQPVLARFIHSSEIRDPNLMPNGR